MKEPEEQVFADLQDTYTQQQAKAEIDQILKKYGQECEIIFRATAAEIIDSYKVSAMTDRHRICAILSRCGVTERNYEDLSAEWKVHNAAWELHVMRGHAKDVSLDYVSDPRKSVRAATALFDALDME